MSVPTLPVDLDLTKPAGREFLQNLSNVLSGVNDEFGTDEGTLKSRVSELETISQNGLIERSEHRGESLNDVATITVGLTETTILNFSLDVKKENSEIWVVFTPTCNAGANTEIGAYLNRNGERVGTWVGSVFTGGAYPSITFKDTPSSSGNTSYSVSMAFGTDSDVYWNSTTAIVDQIRTE